VLYFASNLTREQGTWEWEIRCVRGESTTAEAVTRISGSRIPVSPLFCHPSLSPDGRWLALPLADRATSNIWLIATADGVQRQITDFADLPTTIARQLAWSPDGRQLYAAVARNSADIVVLDGLI
jgi:Tol biopolymer transport system component